MYSMDRTHPQVAGYLTYMKRIAQLYGATKESAETFAESNFEFEKKLADVSIVYLKVTSIIHVYNHSCCISQLTLLYILVCTLGKKLTTMLSTFKSVLFPGHNHLLTTGVDDPSL